jgi:hypothetical protein
MLGVGVFPLLVNQLLGNNLAISSYTLTKTQKWGMVRKITHFRTRYVKIITKHSCLWCWETNKYTITKMGDHKTRLCQVLWMLKVRGCIEWI